MKITPIQKVMRAHTHTHIHTRTCEIKRERIADSYKPKLQINTWTILLINIYINTSNNSEARKNQLYYWLKFAVYTNPSYRTKHWMNLYSTQK